jgi:hypothetical protein
MLGEVSDIDRSFDLARAAQRAPSLEGQAPASLDWVLLGGVGPLRTGPVEAGGGQTRIKICSPELCNTVT